MDDPREPGWFEPPPRGGTPDYTVKREYQRIIFRRIMGVYTFLETQDIMEVEILNISPKGCALRVRKEAAEFMDGEELALRFYFTLDTYLPARVQIRNRRDNMEAGVAFVIYGCQFDRTLGAYTCLRNFIRNIYLYIESCIQDNRGSVFTT